MSILGRAFWIDAVGDRPGSMAAETHEANIWERERRVAEVFLKTIKPRSPPRVSLPTRSNRPPLEDEFMAWFLISHVSGEKSGKTPQVPCWPLQATRFTNHRDWVGWGSHTNVEIPSLSFSWLMQRDDYGLLKPPPTPESRNASNLHP